MIKLYIYLKIRVKKYIDARGINIGSKKKSLDEWNDETSSHLYSSMILASIGTWKLNTNEMFSATKGQHTSLSVAA
jgi:hypothetical protein